MTGIFLLVVVLLWAVFIAWLISLLLKCINSTVIKAMLAPVLFALLLVAPLTDEIIGGMEFRALCNGNTVLTVDEDQLKNKTLLLQPEPSTYLKGYFLPIMQQHWSYADPDTGEIVISWNAYHATGGLLIRALGISETDAPLTFNGVCYPGGTWPKIFKKLNITVRDKR